MGDSLQDTTCENCGLCISTCPTGAISENVFFKPGPVKLEPVETICNYCSIGCKITINHKNEYVMQVTGANGLVNKDGNLCRYPKFGYHYLNDPSRITKPLYKVDGSFKEISFEDAYEIISDKIKTVQPDENGFFAGARLTNEEMYLIQKFARAGAGTNNINSFHYLNRGEGYTHDSYANVPFEEISGASKIYLIGSEINRDNAVAGFMINQAQHKQKIPLELVTVHKDSPVKHKADITHTIKSYYHFIKAVNYYLVANGFENSLYIKDHCEGFEEYKEQLLKENFVELLELSGVSIMDKVVEFAKQINREMNAVIVFSEKELCGNTVNELYNLAMITGKLGKTSSGLIALKEKNNSQGLVDMGIYPSFGVGAQQIDNTDFAIKLKKTWKVDDLSEKIDDNLYDLLEEGKLKNVFIFGEDPLGCASNKVKVAGWLSVADFVVVQDYFITDTAREANLILPATLPFETGGSFTNTQKVIQPFEKVMESRVSKPGYEQISEIIGLFGVNSSSSIDHIRTEALSLLPSNQNETRISFKYTNKADCNRFFEFGCDNLNKRFEEEFGNSFK
jgi:predicted molibdopterin-dependent oxidoreductase YjgC